MNPARLLIVHHEPTSLALLSSMLSPLGYEIDEASHDRAAVRRLGRGAVDLMIARVDPGDPEALELLAFSRRKHPGIPVILLFPVEDPDQVREAKRMGATAILKFPLRANELRAAVTSACENATSIHSADGPPPGLARARGASHRHPTIELAGSAPVELHPPHPGVEAKRPGADLGILGDDPAFLGAIRLAASVASCDVPVLIVGERGTGKTLVSRMIHDTSERRESPFIDRSSGEECGPGLDCDLFDQLEAGPPHSESPSRLAHADRGTLAIHEVASLSPASQARLLHALVDGEYQPRGSSTTLRVDVRFVISTRENLPALVEKGKLLRALYERINVMPINLPPLRRRGPDVLRLAEHFLGKFSRDVAGSDLRFGPEAVGFLQRHTWPGNVRELENSVRRVVGLVQGPEISLEDLAGGVSQARRPTNRPAARRLHGRVRYNLGTLKQAMEEPEKRIIIQALRATSWNRGEAARALDINRTTLYSKMKKYGLLLEEPEPSQGVERGHFT